jgi:ribonuclease P protein component
VAFYRRAVSEGPVRVGYTTPRALGRAVKRNRIRRRLREAVRLERAAAAPGWEVVFNPRRAAAEAEFAALRTEVQRLFAVLKSKK